MTQGISTSLNITLARLNSIESNFAALENFAARTNTNVENVKSDFKTILDSKLNPEKKDVSSVQSEIIEENIDEDTAIEEKTTANLKSKINILNKTTDYDDIIEQFSEKYGIESDFIKAIIKQESNFNPNATSKKGAMGLMQLMPKTAQSLGILDAYNPNQNIEGGVRHLKNLLDNFDGNKELALAAYNAGSGNVKKYGGVPPYKETQNYVNSIMNAYNKNKGAQI